ncbi:4a-hydroxytetrahydrobiopterin dehydratase [Leptothoe kymatousa]|uniref:4a-hydroxytetrahydrobiopterin dehydratase n=1 Tax=Leptothoe kymatousa TAU-MAC 1615 TaxID=2364775 RepID=A0ABS5XZS6_9CYAN|nr:4a-hydroxytetrahydrobiopterin dehydratase [Leptothoe kymatousa]MBT9311102.1 4a-hydroxytetrahydrobiopterin dehydratase [Leptothoe kymatousa TAU-MAC 1615]
MLHALFLISSLHAGAEVLALPTQGDQGNVVDTKNKLTRLSDGEIQLRMQQLPGWTTDGKSLFHTRTFEDFVAAVEFVNSLVDPAETLAHHPDITINYNQVSLEVTTHDAGGLTELDFELATIVSQL